MRSRRRPWHVVSHSGAFLCPCRQVSRVSVFTYSCAAQAWHPKDFTVKFRFVPPHGIVTGTSASTRFRPRQRVCHLPLFPPPAMAEIPGSVCRFLITASSDGMLSVWDVKRRKLLRNRSLTAHECGVRLLEYNNQLRIAATAGMPWNVPKIKPRPLPCRFPRLDWFCPRVLFGHTHVCLSPRLQLLTPTL